MRCCANCCWSISSDMTINILEEQGYDDNIDLVGECCLGNRREISQTICSTHLYDDGSDECLYRVDKLDNGYIYF